MFEIVREDENIQIQAIILGDNMLNSKKERSLGFRGLRNASISAAQQDPQFKLDGFSF